MSWIQRSKKRKLRRAVPQNLTELSTKICPVPPRYYWPPTRIKLMVDSPRLGTFNKWFLADSDTPREMLVPMILTGVERLSNELYNWFPEHERKPTAQIALETALEINRKLKESEGPYSDKKAKWS